MKVAWISEAVNGVVLLVKNCLILLPMWKTGWCRKVSQFSDRSEGQILANERLVWGWVWPIRGQRLTGGVKRWRLEVTRTDSTRQLCSTRPRRHSQYQYAIENIMIQSSLLVFLLLFCAFLMDIFYMKGQISSINGFKDANLTFVLRLLSWMERFHVSC